MQFEKTITLTIPSIPQSNYPTIEQKAPVTMKESCYSLMKEIRG